MATYAKILKDNAGNQILPYTRSELEYNKNERYFPSSMNCSTIRRFFCSKYSPRDHILGIQIIHTGIKTIYNKHNKNRIDIQKETI